MYKAIKKSLNIVLFETALRETQGLSWHFIHSEFVAKIHFSYEINVGPRVLFSFSFFQFSHVAPKVGISQKRI
jgi:hypothetical protein